MAEMLNAQVIEGKDTEETAADLLMNEAPDWEAVATQLGRQLRLHWTAAHVLATKAKNPNIRATLARSLGELYREVCYHEDDADPSKPEDRMWSELSLQPGFQQTRHPLGPKGGRLPSEDLVRWTENAMDSKIKPLWKEAVHVATRASSAGRRGGRLSLERSWEQYHRFTEESQSVAEAQAEALSDGNARAEALAESGQVLASRLLLRDHPFTKLSLDQLLSFRDLWDAALAALLQTVWNQERQDKTLAVDGDRQFTKRSAVIRSIAAHHFLSCRWSDEGKWVEFLKQALAADESGPLPAMDADEKKALRQEAAQYVRILKRKPQNK